jgi:lipopolysaccharide transport system permease protein
MDAQLTIIEPDKGASHYWKELWRYRSLLRFMAWRDIKVRYRQTALGVAWALIQPAVQTLLLSFVFGRLAGFSDATVPYSLVVLSGLIPWMFFNNAFTNTSGSLATNSHLLTKVYFPRLIIPMSGLAVGMVDGAIMLALTLAYAAYLGFVPSLTILWLPLFILPLIVLTLGCGLWIAVLSVQLRDLRFIVPFALQGGLFVTPVGYRASGLGRWQGLIELNPLSGIVENIRWSILGSGTPPTLHSVLYPALVSVALLATGIAYFRHSEDKFADII